MREPPSRTARKALLCLGHGGLLAWMDRRHADLGRSCMRRGGLTTSEIARHFRREARTGRRAADAG